MFVPSHRRALFHVGFVVGVSVSGVSWPLEMVLCESLLVAGVFVLSVCSFVLLFARRRSVRGLLQEACCGGAAVSGGWCLFRLLVSSRLVYLYSGIWCSKEFLLAALFRELLALGFCYRVG
ncbi:hypothetical protein A2U01_0018896, partial [Trifolium medium]|nr:hypothetical protein [Trifolium medium]